MSEEENEQQNMHPLLRFVNLQPIDASKMRALENSYRRGYLHGVAEVVLYLQRGRSILEVERWLNGALREWRSETHDGSVKLPPKIGA